MIGVSNFFSLLVLNDYLLNMKYENTLKAYDCLEFIAVRVKTISWSIDCMQRF